MLINPLILSSVIGVAAFKGEFKRLLMFDEDWCIEEAQEE